MNFDGMTFWVVVVLVVLYGIVCILETLSKDENSQNGVSSEDNHNCCRGNDYNDKNSQESMKYRCEDNSLEEEEKAMLGMASCVNSDNNDNTLYSFDEACSILEDRMRSRVRERGLRGITGFEFVKGDTFWQKSSLRALDSEGYCLAMANTDFSFVGWKQKDFDPLKIEIMVRVRKVDDGVSDKGIHVGAHYASVDEYNKWLKKYLKRGNPTSNYDYPFPSKKFVVVDDPDNYPDMYDENMCGVNALNFIIPKKYDVKKYVKKFGVGHCGVFGWSDGVAINYEFGVPVYTNTIDKMKNVILKSDERKPGDKMFIGVSLSRRGDVFYRNAPKGIWAVQVDDINVSQVKRMIGNGACYNILESIFVMIGKEILTFDDILSAKKCFLENVWSKFIGEKENQDDSAPASNPVDDADRCGEDMPSVW
jgi:hypothetical protein